MGGMKIRIDFDFDESDYENSRDERIKYDRMMAAEKMYLLLDGIQSEMRKVMRAEDGAVAYYQGSKVSSVEELANKVMDHIYDEIRIDEYGYGGW